MGRLRRLLVAGAGAATLIGATAVSVGASESRLIEFESMTPVSGGAVGTANDRGITGGGLPWVITSGTGAIDRQGNLEVSVSGLVLAAGPKTGTNPLSPFNAVVSCITPHGIVNVASMGSAASTTGDSTITDTIALPHPCKAPEVFVGFTNPSTGAFIWFAESNAEDSD